MKIQVNGEAMELAGQTSIQDLLAQLEMTQGRVAVEVNADIVPRSLHPQHLLNEGDRVEIVHAIGGG
ncbi:sulfur carrier protein ThiS [Pseudohongiella sp.]|uniref:Sulfur carrier protein ThiS n=1 Tax=marine sediment metagenome TaxID=412755 RepID=A0A0F9YAD3_9ZZZZ|nr:sulfur carrier protein ThiS [Pseudohongiella sp.]HDZ08051.1 sulfur carrier protein ThiS [Pseudohongiella sp.]HEA64106.1 sulfur carrier protein ThiS [Pseudohongiella sp.]